MRLKFFRTLLILSFLLLSGTACAVRPAGAPLSATASPQPLARTPPVSPLAGVYAALDAYQPPHATPKILRALTSDIAGWLSNGGDPSLLPGLLRTLPKLQTVQPTVDRADLNGDGLEDVVVQTQLMGLPVLAFLQQGGGQYLGLTLPPAFDKPLPTLQSGFLARDLTGDRRPETVVTYTVPGGSQSTELLYVFRWDEINPALIFRADLITWAGPSAWALEPDPTAPGRLQFRLTYPYLYRDGFDQKMLPHPLGWQVWRWDDGAGRFVQAESGVDRERRADAPDIPVTARDRLLWHVHEAERAFRSGEYEAALEKYEQVLKIAEAWERGLGEPDWQGWARFRRGEILLLLGRTDEAQAQLRTVAEAYPDDSLGKLAAACLSGATEDTPDAPARCVAAMQRVRLGQPLDVQCGQRALCFPLDNMGILYPPVGIAAYLNAHPENDRNLQDIRVGLETVGFSVVSVLPAEGGNLEVRLEDFPLGCVLVRDSEGRWRPHRRPPVCLLHSSLWPGVCWPRVGEYEE